MVEIKTTKDGATITSGNNQITVSKQDLFKLYRESLRAHRVHLAAENISKRIGEAHGGIVNVRDVMRSTNKAKKRDVLEAAKLLGLKVKVRKCPEYQNVNQTFLFRG